MTAIASKRTVRELAISGSAPAFADPVYVGSPNLGHRDKLFERLNDLLDRRRLTNDGPLVQAFERAIRDRIGVRHAIATSNATIALSIAARALGMTGEVIVPAFTFVATAHALLWQNVKPVLCDVDPGTYLLDPAAAERLITPRTTGILPVHLWGQPCAVEELTELAERKGLRLLFDASHAFGCETGGRAIGSFGDAEVFSFHATKFVNSFEGGAIVTNDDQLADRIRLMRNFGFADFDDVQSEGINAKMHEASAAMGLTSLESADDFVRVNRRNHARYREHLSGLAGIRLLEPRAGDTSNFQYVVLVVDQDGAGISRDELKQALEAEGVMARRYFYPGLHAMEPYRSLYRLKDRDLPHTARAAQQLLCLPTGTAISCAAVDQVCAIIRAVLADTAAVRKQLSDLRSA